MPEARVYLDGDILQKRGFQSADQADIVFNGNYTAPVATGRGSISMVIKCTKSKVWAVGDRLLGTINSASCIMKRKKFYNLRL
ncbi:unnamed protein product [Anisakis simplex]|uniref:TonB-dependent receptor n=1 Tax=Anisakis simplex TaxID=6269 RepID=A0A0M3JGG8_ANISI|nr:unnamed protein product [Anisakis simplex]